ncbi:MAG: phosphatase PAP2 family protein [Oceanicaulis sp.]
MQTALTRARTLLDRFPIELTSVAALVVIGLSLAIFAGVADNVLEGDTQEIDQMILLALRTRGDIENPIGPGWFEYAVADITALGGYAVLTLLVSFSAIYLILVRRPGTAALLVASIISGTSLVAVFKANFDRARPDLVDHLTHATSSSFPSGHATAAALTYLTLGLMLASAQPRKRARVFIVWSALFVAILVGCSRIYLGVHWPTDVVAGWGFGAAWAIVWWLGARLIVNRSPGPQQDQVTKA